LDESHRDLPVVMFWGVGLSKVPDRPVVRIHKDQVDLLAAALGLDVSAETRMRDLTIIDLVAAEADGLVADWSELCRWDPMLPPDSQPPLAPAVIVALARALARPQPLGWGPDPEIEQITEV